MGEESPLEQLWSCWNCTSTTPLPFSLLSSYSSALGLLIFSHREHHRDQRSRRLVAVSTGLVGASALRAGMGRADPRFAHWSAWFLLRELHRRVQVALDSSRCTLPGFLLLHRELHTRAQVAVFLVQLTGLLVHLHRELEDASNGRVTCWSNFLLHVSSCWFWFSSMCTALDFNFFMQ
ncbi:hypothetical protein ACOSP7_032016 [Xanthoceras sorbifolium]